MRTSSAAVLVLAACSPGAGETPVSSGLVDCAPAGAAEFARSCAVEHVREGAALTLVVRHPDGGFRRFAVTADGRGVAPADGAEPAKVSRHGDGIEVAVGTDRYRFPATVAQHDRR